MKLPQLKQALLWGAGGVVAATGVAVIAGALAGRRSNPIAAGVYARAWREVRGFPHPSNADVLIGESGPTLGYVTVKPRLDVMSVGGLANALGGQRGREAAMYAASVAIEAEFARRRRLLPRDANPLAPDKYSRELFVYARTHRNVNTRYYPGHAGEVSQWYYSPGAPCAIDEFGRVASCATADSQFVPLIGKILDITLPIVAVAVPGYGTAIYSGYLMVKSVAAGGDWKDLAVAAARSQIPPGLEQAAFDFGVAVVLKKQSIGDAGEAALVGQMTPGQQQAYAHGKAAAEAGLAGDYGEATRRGLLAYYTPR